MARPSVAAPRLAGARFQGERHRQAGQPCCDALLLVSSAPMARRSGWRSGGAGPLASKAKGVAGFVICDGAGGSEAVALAAQRGARAAMRALLALRQLRRRHRLRFGSGRSLTQERMARCFLAAFANASNGCHANRQPSNGPPSNSGLSCRPPAPAPAPDHTMLACLWDGQQLLIARVGDCSLLLRRHGRWELPLAPQKGEAASETVFLRPGLPPALLGLCCLPTDGIEAVIGFSDGLEAAFLSPTPGEPSRLAINAPLADLVLDQHRSRCGWRGYAAWLEESLADPSLAQLSDDDRTLVIACR